MPRFDQPATPAPLVKATDSAGSATLGFTCTAGSSATVAVTPADVASFQAKIFDAGESSKAWP